MTFTDTDEHLDDAMLESLQRLPNLRQISVSASEIQSLLDRGRFGILSKITSLTSIQCLGQLQEKKIRNTFVEKRVPAELSGIVSFITTQHDLHMYDDICTPSCILLTTICRRHMLDDFIDSEDDSQVPSEGDE